MRKNDNSRLREYARRILSHDRTAQTFSIYTLAIPFGSNRLEAINIGERERHSGRNLVSDSAGRQATLSSRVRGTVKGWNCARSYRSRPLPHLPSSPLTSPPPSLLFAALRGINKYIFAWHTRNQLSMTLIPLVRTDAAWGLDAGVVERNGRKRSEIRAPILSSFPWFLQSHVTNDRAATFYPRYQSDIIVRSRCACKTRSNVALTYSLMFNNLHSLFFISLPFTREILINLEL